MIEGNIWLMLILQVVLIALNALFACAEIAVISLSESKLDKLAQDGSKKAKRLKKLTAQPARFLATIQVAITLAGFLGSAFAADSFSDPLVAWLIGLGVKLPEKTLDTAAVILITLVLSYFTLVFGELVPKRLAQRRSESIALGISGLVSAVAHLFAPLVSLLTASTNGVLRLMGVDPDAGESDVSEEDIRVMVDSGAKSGSIDSEEREFIQNVFEFDDLTAGEICTHRTDVHLLWMDETDEEWSAAIHDSCHNFYPVCDETVDNVVGVLYLKDYFRQSDRSRENIMKTAVKTPYFIPESAKADVLFRNMKAQNKTFGVVLDEYGGLRGILTLYDLVGRLVGDLGGEENPEKAEPTVEAVDEMSWTVKGNAEFDDVAAAIGLVPEEESGFDTFSGFVFSELGSIPDDGTSFEVEIAGFRIEVLEVRDHQIECARITRLEPPEPDEDEDEKDDD